MAETIAYASPTTPTLVRPVVGRIAAAVAIVSAGFIVGVALYTRLWLESYAPIVRGCGTPRLMMQDQLYFLTPALCVVPIGAWSAAHKAQFGLPLCRGSVILALAGWAVCALLG